MAMKTKSDLKKVFSGLSSIYLKKDGIASFDNMEFDMDLPVTVDSLSMSQETPTLNSTKVHGLQTDWCVIAEAGAFNFSATVPSIDDDLTDYFYGNGKTISAATVNGQSGWSGKAYEQKSVKLYAGFGLLSESGKDLIAIKKIAIYATPNFENGSTTPFSFTLTGTIEASEGSEEENIAFLHRA